MVGLVLNQRFWTSILVTSTLMKMITHISYCLLYNTIFLEFVFILYDRPGLGPDRTRTGPYGPGPMRFRARVRLQSDRTSRFRSGPTKLIRTWPGPDLGQSTIQLSTFLLTFFIIHKNGYSTFDILIDFLPTSVRFILKVGEWKDCFIGWVKVPINFCLTFTDDFTTGPCMRYCSVELVP